MNTELLKILVCPETHQNVQAASPDQISALNEEIKAGSIRNRAGQVLSAPLEAGLVRADGRVMYPVRGGLPIMLIDEAIPL